MALLGLVLKLEEPYTKVEHYRMHLRWLLNRHRVYEGLKKLEDAGVKIFLPPHYTEENYIRVELDGTVVLDDFAEFNMFNSDMWNSIRAYE